MLTLDDLVTPDGLAGFLQAFAGKTRWYLRTGRAAGAEALLPWATLEALISNSLVPVDQFRVVINANELPKEVYSDAHGRLRTDAVQGFATQGATLVINNIGALVPALGELTTAMERDLRCRVQVNGYVTFGALSAFRPHHDDHDVLALQVHGAKLWRSYGTPVPYPIDKVSIAVDPAPIWEGPMTPGDLLYLPRGEVHAAAPQARPSVHLTFGISEPTGADFLRWLAVRAKGVETLRRDLGAILAGAARGEREAALRAALHELVDGATVEDFLADQDHERPPRAIAALGAGPGGGRFGPETRLISALRRRLDLAADQEGEVLLSLGPRSVRLPQFARRALVEITGRHRITVAELAASLGCAADASELTACLEDLAAKCLITSAT